MSVDFRFARRTAAQLQALRRFAMTWAWDQARHIVSCYAPSTRDLVTEARRLLARGWVEAKLAERHGYLTVAAPAVTIGATPAARSVARVRAEIEDMENHDRLGAYGLARLSALRTEIHAIEVRAH